MKTAKQTKQKLRRLFRGSLTLAMAFVVATSTVATAYASYANIIIEHIWVDNNNTEVTIEKVETDKPDEETTKPGGETTEPGGETAEPGGETTEPGGETTEPGGETTEPGGEAAEPGGETTEPAEPSAPKPPRPVDIKEDVTAWGVTEGKDWTSADVRTDVEEAIGEGNKENHGDTHTVVDNGSEAGRHQGYTDRNSGNDDLIGKGYDEGFKEGYEDAYKWPSNKPEWPESDPSENRVEVEIEGEKYEYVGKIELDKELDTAIKDVLTQDKDNDLILDGANREDIDKITDAYLGEKKDAYAVNNDGNVWTATKKYGSSGGTDGLKTTVGEGDEEKEIPVIYKVELSEETQKALSDAGYDTVQLKITIETPAKWNESAGKNVSKKYVSIDGGVTWTNCDPNDPTQYDPAKDYVETTTYTFMHVKKDPELPKPEEPEKPEKPDKPEEPDKPTPPPSNNDDDPPPPPRDDDDDDDDYTPPPRTYVEIPDEPVPMSATPRLLENYIEILDEDVPLAVLPSEPGTGAVSHRSLWATILIASLGGLLILLHKDEEEAA